MGGSLITDKNTPHTHRPEALARLAAEIYEAWQQNRELKILLGHGSGSFGHVPGRKYGTRLGVHSVDEWTGFVEVWREARALNQLVMDALLDAGLPAVAFPPSASVISRAGQVEEWNLNPMLAALENGLLPVIQGDVIFDRERGGTILSTEDLFFYLANRLKPGRILLAGVEEGVWRDYPACRELIPLIDPKTYPKISEALKGSAAVDVTGGMRTKVERMLTLAVSIPGLEIAVFSGEQPGLVKEAILGAAPGTRIIGDRKEGEI